MDFVSCSGVRRAAGPRFIAAGMRSTWESSKVNCSAVQLSGLSIALIVDILMNVALLALLSQILAGVFDDELACGTSIARGWISAGPLGATACRRDLSCE